MTVKKGTQISIPIFALHRDKEVFGDDAEEFNPSRFEGEDGKKLADHIAFQGFGGGPRICIGKRFALTEIKITVAKILANYELADPSEIDFLPGSPFILKFDETKMRFKKRDLPV